MKANQQILDKRAKAAQAFKKDFSRAERRAAGYRGPYNKDRWEEGSSQSSGSLVFTVRNQSWVGGASERKRQESVSLRGLA